MVLTLYNQKIYLSLMMEDIQCVIVLNAVKLFHIVFVLHRTMYYFINAGSLHLFGIRGVT